MAQQQTHIISITLALLIQSVHLDPKIKFLKSARLTADFIPSTMLPDVVNVENTVTTMNMVPVVPSITTTTTMNPTLTSSSSELNPNITLPDQFANDSNSSSENRLRWVDFNHHYQPFPPIRLSPAASPVISNGFRSPISSQTSSNSGIIHLTSTTTTTTSTEASIEALNGIYNTNHHNFVNGLSPANSMGFPANPILDDELLFSLANPKAHLTRVEHIVAECSDEFMKVVVRFNGTFNGLIYSSGYVHDRGCIYVNGSGRNHFEFFIRLNQCGTLGRQEMYHPSMPGEARRRDQLMWNTLSIQYNPLIEDEFDEHFRLTCEYGSDFWKTVTFPAVNVEVNTGSPVVFTINPPQCQMEIRRGFGIAGTRTSGPVTVGDPLTLLIHMKSEKVGFDILVKNCVAHNGAQQRMQLIDSNGCVTNEKLISPFRGTYNSDGGHQVSLYAYLKAFRFTGSMALYLECDIHMCHNRCPPQRCYWRNLSKRSAKLQTFEDGFNRTAKPLLSESISLFQALEVHHDEDEEISESIRQERKHEDVLCLRQSGLAIIVILMVSMVTISISTCLCYCLRIRKLKHWKHGFTQFDYQLKLGRQTPLTATNVTNVDRRSMPGGYSDYASSVQHPAYRGRFFRFY